ncbi:aldo/keto reductase [Candidatus Aerophobetes bacterium]|nr:aldo/keto reductase [Candidatus Aerophobetes bacterium]
MKMKRLGKTGLMVSEVGMGGIPITRLGKKEAVKVIRGVIDLGVNFIDTAHSYSDSEEKIGKAVEKIRYKVIIASKSGALDKKSFLKEFELSLRRLKTDYIDIYQLHAVREANLEEIMGAGGAFEALLEVHKQGKARHIGFTTHNMDVALKLLEKEEFETIQIPVNFLEENSFEKVISLARKFDVGIIAMKPFAGGAIEDAKIAFRYLSQFEEIVPIPGVESVEQMKEIIEIVENPSSLTLEDKEKMERIRKELGTSFCHGCDYCQPCPQGIPIGLVLRVESLMRRFPFEVVMERFGDKIKKAKDCKECKKCLDKCPYNLPVPSLLKEKLALFEESKRTFMKKRRRELI